MLKTNPVTQFSLTVDNLAYLQVGDRHRLAVDTFRKLPGMDYKLDRSGVPKVERVNLDNRDNRQKEVQEFATEIYDLNGLWARLITNRPAFHYELTQFPHTGYRKKSLIPNSVERPDKALKMTEATDNRRDGSAKIDLEEVLGSTMDNSDKTRKRRADHSIESRKWHAYLRIEPYFNIFGTFGLFMPDVGYALSILGAFGIGMKHVDSKVRKSSVEILNAIAQGTVVKLHADLGQTGTSDDSVLKQAYAEDAKSVLSGVLKLLCCPSFGLQDDNEEVKSLATTLEANLLNALADISRLVKPNVIEPYKVLKL